MEDVSGAGQLPHAHRWVEGCLLSYALSGFDQASVKVFQWQCIYCFSTDMFNNLTLPGSFNSTALFAFSWNSPCLFPVLSCSPPWVTDAPYFKSPEAISTDFVYLRISSQAMAINHQHLLQPAKELATYVIQTPLCCFQTLKYMLLKCFSDIVYKY